jgi:hypothetical protein
MPECESGRCDQCMRVEDPDEDQIEEEHFDGRLGAG